MKRFYPVGILTLGFLLVSCGTPAESPKNISYSSIDSTFTVQSFGQFNEPWAMTFLPNGNLLVTEKSGNLLLVNMSDMTRQDIFGLPDVAYAGQGGLGDVVLHPEFKDNQWLYFSFAEQDKSGNKGAAVARAKLNLTSSNPSLESLDIIWRQFPKIDGSGHYSHRIAFDSENYLFITSGDRQEQNPAQDWSKNLGKIIRLNDDGTLPSDNPFQDKGELAKSFWTLGHRNMLGLAFDEDGKLWSHEMGPKHGDEFNHIIKGDNYGWPIVSWGDQYTGIPIPDHDTRPEFHAPEAYWVPTIAPSGLIIYNAALFTSWKGNALLGGLRSQSLIRLNITENKAVEAERFDMGKRIREIEQGPTGAIWLLEDGESGRLLKLTPAT